MCLSDKFASRREPPGYPGSRRPSASVNSDVGPDLQAVRVAADSVGAALPTRRAPTSRASPIIPGRCPRYLRSMASAFRQMMRKDRGRQGLRECRAAWQIGVSVREYREIEAGERDPDLVTWRRMVDVFNWPKAFLSERRDR
jgi:hypothetical protein